MRRALFVLAWLLVLSCQPAIQNETRAPATGAAANDVLALESEDGALLLLRADGSRVAAIDLRSVPPTARAVAGTSLFSFVDDPSTLARQGGSIRELDLRTGSERPLAAVPPLPNGLAGPLAAPGLAVTRDAIALVRTSSSATRDQARVEVFDRTTGQRTVTRDVIAPLGSTRRWSIRPLPRGGYLLVERALEARPRAVRWTVLDAALRELASADSDETGKGLLYFCDTDLKESGGALVAPCAYGGSGPDALAVFDGSFALRPLELPANSVIGSRHSLHVLPDGSLALLTWAPAIVRIDVATGHVSAKRPLRDGRASLRWPFAPLVAAAKVPLGQSALLSPDGRTLYALSYDDTQWWAPLAAIDVESATVRFTALAPRSATSLELTADGTRLYVLAQPGSPDGPGEIVAVDARTGRVLSRAAVPGSWSYRMVAVTTP